MYNKYILGFVLDCRHIALLTWFQQSKLLKFWNFIENCADSSNNGAYIAKIKFAKSTLYSVQSFVLRISFSDLSLNPGGIASNSLCEL